MSSQFNMIGVFGRAKNPAIKETLECLIAYLKAIGQFFCIEKETADLLKHNNKLLTIDRKQLSDTCDILIVVGGDGSMLHAAHAVLNQSIPVLGINRGSLGFLTDILPTEFEKIRDILEGNYSIEKRFLLSAEITYHDQLIGKDDALNEVAFIPDVIPHIIEFELYINDNFLCSQDSDGLIIATPTGSTAYALSGGGPILHPQLDAVVLVPMFPHTLSSRPIVIDGNKKIKIIVSTDNATSPRLSCDGRAILPAPAGSHILIQKNPNPLHLIHPLDYDYYGALRSKLHWGKKLC